MNNASTVQLVGADNGMVTLCDGIITAWNPNTDPTHTDAILLDCGSGTIDVGDVNAHTHIYSGLAPLGMPVPSQPPSNFPQILEQIWWKLDRALDADTLRASAQLYAAEALLSGTTTLLDHHESPNAIEGSLDIIANACETLGIRAILGFGATERNFGRKEAQRGLDECARFISENKRAAVYGVVALHASFTVSDDTIRQAGELARELGTVVHVHLAEDLVDVQDAKQRGYAGPLERFEELEGLPYGSILAHGVHLSANQVRHASDAGWWLVQNPRSNENNRVGYPANLQHGRRVALGTDGYPSDIREEQSALEKLASANGDNISAARARITRGQVLLSERCGQLFAPQPGAVGDLCVRDSSGAIRHVVVDGRVVVRDYTLLTGDISKIRANAQEQAQRLWQRMRQV